MSAHDGNNVRISGNTIANTSNHPGILVGPVTKIVVKGNVERSAS